MKQVLRALNSQKRDEATVLLRQFLAILFRVWTKPPRCNGRLETILSQVPRQHPAIVGPKNHNRSWCLRPRARLRVPNSFPLFVVVIALRTKLLLCSPRTHVECAARIASTLLMYSASRISCAKLSLSIVTVLYMVRDNNLDTILHRLKHNEWNPFIPFCCFSSSQNEATNLIRSFHNSMFHLPSSSLGPKSPLPI